MLVLEVAFRRFMAVARHQAKRSRLLLLVLSGCATMQEARPSSVSIPDAPTAHRAAVRALVDEGYTISLNDRESGVIQTDWMQVDMDAGRQVLMDTVDTRAYWRQRVVVRINDSSASVRVEMQTCTTLSGCRGFGALSDDAIRQQRHIARRLELAKLAKSKPAAEPKTPKEPTPEEPEDPEDDGRMGFGRQ